MAKMLVLHVVGQIVDAASPDAAVVAGKANISAPVAGAISFSAISPGNVRSLDAAKQPSPVSMAGNLSGGGNISAASLQAYINSFMGK